MHGDQTTTGSDKALAAASVSMKGAHQRSRGDSISKWKGMLWCEWFSQSKMLLSFVAVWLAGVWILPLFANPGWILLIGGVFALIAAPAYGGGDTVEGCEEFTFSLPATRLERFWARFIIGGGALLIFSLLDMAVLGFDLPQILSRVYSDSGLLTRRPVSDPRLLYGLVVTLPFSVFCVGFMIASNTHSKALVLLSGFWGALISLLVLRCGLIYEKWRWDEWNGFLSYPLLLVTGFLAAWCGSRLYRAKEIGQATRPLVIPAHWWLWILFFLIGVGVVFALSASLIRGFSRVLN